MSIFKRSVLGFSLVACATLFLPVFTGTANAAPGALIRNYQSGKCLDADANFLGYNGDRVQLWDCNGGTNQKWLPIPVNSNVKNRVILENAADGKCLDADANGLNNNGTRMQLWDCGRFTNPAEQTWDMLNVYGSTTDWVFRNLANGKVLDADANSVNNNGGKVQLWDWWGGVNQIWQG